MKPSVIAVASSLLALLVSRPSLAQPSVWSLAADPKEAVVAEATLELEALLTDFAALERGLADGTVLTPPTSIRTIVLDKARRILVAAGAETSAVPALRHQLAEIHYHLFDVERDPAHLEKALGHYRFVGESPEAPTLVRASAHTSVALCYARLGQHAEESAAYDRALALQPDPGQHAVLLANQAEGEMARGRILEAVRGYRAALRATSGIHMLASGVTTLWGLGVALDRAGDLPGALAQIALARSYDPADVQIHGPGWIFIPSYDEAWYAALGHWQRARDADEVLDRLEAYRDAETAWRSFLSRAEPSDPWLPLAARRLSELEREHRALIAKTPPAVINGPHPRD